jgi:hypothetical protein
MKILLMVWTLEALEVHYFSIRLTLRRIFEIKHMFGVNTVQQPNHMLIFQLMDHDIQLISWSNIKWIIEFNEF